MSCQLITFSCQVSAPYSKTPIPSCLYQQYCAIPCSIIHRRSPLFTLISNQPLLGQNLNTLDFSVRLAGINLLARLRDRLQNGLVREGGLCDDGGGLCVEGDIVGFNACGREALAES
jgi:hypothetical protein